MIILIVLLIFLTFQKKNIDLPNAQLYIMKSSYIKKEIKFNVKNVNEIPIKIREVIKNDK